MDTVVFIAVIGRKVIATAKPPDGVFTFFFSDKEAHIGMGRWHIGVVRVDHQRYAHGLKASASQFRAMLRGGGWHLIAKDMGEIHAAFLNRWAIDHNTTAATATFVSDPAILLPLGTIFGMQRCADAILQF